MGEMRTELIELGEMVCARHRIPAGFDSAPYYRSFPDQACPCEHWCYLVKGLLRYRFADGAILIAEPGDAFHLRPGHLADVIEDSVLIEFTGAADYRRKAEAVGQAR